MFKVCFEVVLFFLQFSAWIYTRSKKKKKKKKNYTSYWPNFKKPGANWSQLWLTYVWGDAKEQNEQKIVNPYFST